MSDVTTAPVLEVARAFFDACETGKGWEGCQQFCTPDATFSAQAEPLEDVSHLGAVHRLDEGPADDPPRRPLRAEVVRADESEITSSRTRCSRHHPAKAAPSHRREAPVRTTST